MVAAAAPKWAHRTTADLLAAGNVVLGALVLAGGGERLAGLSFKYVVAVAPFWVWGLLQVGSGAVALLGQAMDWRRPIMLGHWLASALCLFWVIAFVIGAWTAWQDLQVWETTAVPGVPRPPQPALTGIAAYLTLFTLHGHVFGTLIHRRAR